MLNETYHAPPRYNISDFFSSLLEMGDTHFAFHPGDDYYEGDDAKDEEAKQTAQELCERLGNG